MSANHRIADCPNAKAHTPSPEGYLAWHHWADRMSKTHRQVRCPSCELWVIWVPLDRVQPSCYDGGGDG